MLQLNNVPALLNGLTVTAEADMPLPGRVCAEHLALLGARCNLVQARSRYNDADPLLAGVLGLGSTGNGNGSTPDKQIECTIRWNPPHRSVPTLPATEAIIQALSGLMGVHGRDRLVPQRLGLEVASVATGIVATQAALAALIARSRGHSVRGVETTVLQGALLFLVHHLALATCPEPFTMIEPGHASGPPFRTADGHYVEIEVLSFDSWLALWRQLGVERSEIEVAWSSYVYRYLSACCTLPVALHVATGQHTLTELGRVAETCGVAVCRVRGYPELLREQGWWKVPPWEITPGTGRVTINQADRAPTEAPLTGMRVVEITSRLQGPLAGLLLQMLGAEVIKVEPPGGDMGKYAPPRVGSQGAAYLAYNRGKQVVELDYKRPEGLAALADLAASADVFLHNWRSGRAEKLGLDFDDLARANPGLVYAHASGWGRSNPEPAPIAGDFLVQAHAGCGNGLNRADMPALPSRLTLIDVTGGLLACEGILAGLYWRERTGQGCRVDTSLLAGAMALQSQVLRAIASEQETGRRMGRPLWGPLHQPIQTADELVMIDAADALARSRVANVVGMTDMTTLEGQAEQRIAERFRIRPASEWAELLAEARIPAAVVRTDLASAPQDLLLSGLLETIDDVCWVPAPPWQIKA